MTDIKQWTNTPSWTATLEEDPETGDLILPFSPDFLAQVGWDSGDTLIWTEHNDGSYTLSKKEELDTKIVVPLKED